jgi:hypothetical protein
MPADLAHRHSRDRDSCRCNPLSQCPTRVAEIGPGKSDKGDERKYGKRGGKNPFSLAFIGMGEKAKG